MKKIFYSIMAAVALSLTLTACGSDGDESYNYSTTAEQATAGTYAGTWTRTSDDGTQETFSGTVTLAATSEKGKTNVTFSCPDADLNATSIANVWNAKNDFQFMNQTVSDANGLGVAFSGFISEAGVLNTAFTISQKVGRKTVSYTYDFTGNK